MSGFTFSKISTGLYIGDYFASINKRLLETNRITHIVVCGQELTKRFPLDFNYLHLVLDDVPTQQISQYFELAYSFISEGIKSGGVLIHCAQGRSRSSSILISYLMREKQMTFNRAFNKVLKKHPIADPNPGFRSQLIEYENIILNT